PTMEGERRKHSCRLHCAPRQRTFLPMLVYRACTRTARPSAVSPPSSTGFVGIGPECLTCAPSGRKSPIVNHRKSKSPLTTDRPVRDNLLYQIVRTHPRLSCSIRRIQRGVVQQDVSHFIL